MSRSFREKPPPARPSFRPMAVFSAAAVIFACLCSCATSLPALGDDVLVTYSAVRSSGPPVRLMLINENHSGYAALSAANMDRASVKKIPHDMFRELLGRLADRGFFETAESSAAPAKEGKQVITVETPAAKWVLSPDPSFTAEDRRKFTAMSADIWNCHNSVTTIQVIENKKGGDFFYEERERLKKESLKRQPIK